MSAGLVHWLDLPPALEHGLAEIRAKVEALRAEFNAASEEHTAAVKEAQGHRGERVVNADERVYVLAARLEVAEDELEEAELEALSEALAGPDPLSLEAQFADLEPGSSRAFNIAGSSGVVNRCEECFALYTDGASGPHARRCACPFPKGDTP